MPYHNLRLVITCDETLSSNLPMHRFIAPTLESDGRFLARAEARGIVARGCGLLVRRM